MLDYPSHVYQGPPEQAPDCCDQAHIVGLGLTVRLPAAEDGRPAVAVDQSGSEDWFLQYKTEMLTAIPDLAITRQEGLYMPEDGPALTEMGIHWQRQGDQLVPISDETLDSVSGQLQPHHCTEN
jgi:hypothetical protein